MNIRYKILDQHRLNFEYALLLSGLDGIGMILVLCRQPGFDLVFFVAGLEPAALIRLLPKVVTSARF
jgi:hypothetical protein